MRTAFTDFRLLDGSADTAAREGLTLLVEDGVIRDVAPSGVSPEGFETVPLGGRYVMPGLINLHVHLPASGKPTKKPMDSKKLVRIMTSCGAARRALDALCAGYAKTELLSGVTTLRAVGGVEDCDSRLRDKIAAGRATGPRILAADMAISVPGGHMAGSLACEVTSPEEAREAVRRIAEGKPDLIKLMITGGVLDATVRGEPGVLRMSPDIIKSACDAAHALGLPVAAHVESPEGMRAALQNGVDTIEHGAKPDAELLRLFRERGAALVATISPALPYALFPLERSRCTALEHYNGRVVFDGIVECARACLEAGVPVGLGTDTGCPFTTHYNMWRELRWFKEFCGVSRAFALRTATSLNAEIAGLSGVTGAVAPGLAADLLVTDKNPLDDLRALETPYMVVARGVVHREPRVKKMPQVETELDKY